MNGVSSHRNVHWGLEVLSDAIALHWNGLRIFLNAWQSPATEPHKHTQCSANGSNDLWSVINSSGGIVGSGKCPIIHLKCKTKNKLLSVLLVLISVLYHILLRLHQIVQRSSFLHEIRRSAKHERLSFSFRLEISFFPVNILIYRLKRLKLTRIDPAPSFADTIHNSQDRLWCFESDCKRAYTWIPPAIGRHYFSPYKFFENLHWKRIVLPDSEADSASKESSTICNLLLLGKKSIRIDEDENRERCRMPTAITDFLLPSAFIQMKQ